MKRFFLILTLIILNCCESSPTAPLEDTLTGITSTGANTFSCRVNQQIWIPFQKPQPLFDKGPTLIAMIDSRFHNLLIDAVRMRSDNRSSTFEETSSISIRIDSIYSTGAYQINSYNADSTMRPSDTRRTIISTYGMKSVDGYAGQGNGLVNITRFDTTNKIVSGTFNFTVPRKDGSTLNITDGRFDLKISYQLLNVSFKKHCMEIVKFFV